MEEKTIAILKAIAMGEGEDCRCHESTENITVDEATGFLDSEHKDCPVSKARDTLKENGIPLNRYRISFEYYDGINKWHKTFIVEKAFSEEEALAVFKSRKHRNKYYDPDSPMRNIHVSLTHDPPEKRDWRINPY